MLLWPAPVRHPGQKVLGFFSVYTHAHTFFLTGATCFIWGFWEQLLTQLHQFSLPTSYVVFIMCTYQFIFPVWVSASLDFYFSLSDRVITNWGDFLTFKSEAAGALNFSPECCRPMTCFHFTFLKHVSLKWSTVLHLSFVFRLVPKDTNPVVIISIPLFFQPHFCSELVGVPAQ